MALNIKLAKQTGKDAVDAFTARLNDGYLRLYSGTQPIDADTEIDSQILLAEIRFANPAFDAAEDAEPGSITANADISNMTQDVSANASGTATWFRALANDGTSPVFDGSAGTGTHDLVLNSNVISPGAAVEIESCQIKQPLL